MSVENASFTGYIATASALEKLDALAEFMGEAATLHTDLYPWKVYKRVLPKHLHREGPEDVFATFGDPVRSIHIYLMGQPDLGQGIQGSLTGGDRWNISAGAMQETHRFRISINFQYREEDESQVQLPFEEGSTYQFYQLLYSHIDPIGIITQVNLEPSLLAGTGEEIFLSSARSVQIAQIPLPLIEEERIYGHHASFDIELT